MNPLKHIRLALPFILFLGISVFLWQGLSLQPNLIPSPLINQAAPVFKLPTLLDPQKFTTNQDFLGHITLMNVWATWCVACEEEHDFLLKLANHSDVMIYGLNYKDNSEAAKKWLNQSGNPYQIIAVDQIGNVAIDWGVYGTPETFVIDKKGMIRYKHIGAITPKVWELTLEPLVTQLRNETR